ncbi:hypothetical protein EWM64_g4162 [Hericium alpestre]|uniref:Major facilitator superfamily (MFS) profile domain-containing protein n=1 Tax=Hericium alpestre TaxID=135208 RepID=A0A4Y9ZYF4_9AGAM|nr:hypothetical protein EWM64_g4162 [Hericium alpestre]
MAEVRRANGLTEDFELGETQHVHVPSVVYGTPTIEIPVMQSSTSPPKDRRMLLANVQFAALCWSMFMAGWNDGSTGPLLPRIQSVYNVGFAVVSLIFVLNSIAYVIASFLNVVLTDRLGFGKTIVIGLSSLVVGYSIQAAAPPFPLFVISYAINGWGLAFQCAQSIGYVAAYKGDFDAAGRMGFLNAAYECFEEIGQIIENEDQNNDNKYRQIFGLKAVHLLALFILIYVGTEVTIGGWIVTFIIQVRGGGASSGYISTGFFAGMTLGRTGLL